MRKSIKISFSYSFFSNTMGLHFSLLILFFDFSEIFQDLEICFILLFTILKHKGICCVFWSYESSVCLTLMSLHYVRYQKSKIQSEWVGLCGQKKQANSDVFFYVSLLLRIGQTNIINQIPEITQKISFLYLRRSSQGKLIEKSEDAEQYVQDYFDELPIYLFHFHS